MSHGLDTQEMDRRDARERKEHGGRREPNGRCPYCGGSPVHVTNSRVAEDGVVVNRRRGCGACGKRWSTVEAPVGIAVADKAEHITKVRQEARRLVRSLLERLGDEG
jgi:transcriptional regulator NrdR family protein